ncbi:AexT-like T3SS ADP-ribosyltransferase toxin [Aeromonas hydrophila]|uniref:AexT-like T3SS ADP-ribosyltransferase toxin n=1 Tax=Aeromonas hydrophila TaxID=644 RepID=UPI001D0AA573|nr:AexT-like T3SS ADP-ribosyltransferase toxin [Aeromonas hydrophila]ELA9382489.1 AexT-like T3SS ADP-ribosyltransferase toxin [Aeromonas hydrophila]MCC0181874.1 AexT-like T3SS ADP-ribosyltransferase toxin [Aeromonas hydrophila]
MQIQTHTGGLQAVAQHSDAAAGVGKFGQLDARQVATSQDALQLGSRSEPQKGQGLLSRLGAQLARPFVALKEWIGNLLGASPAAPARSAPPADNLSLADQKRLLLQKALPFTLGGLDKASELNNIDAQQLGQEHARLATGNGALRSLATSLNGIKDGSMRQESQTLAAGLLERPIVGIPLQQWGTVGGKVTELIASATPEQLQEAMSQLHAVMAEVADLQRAVKAEVAGEPLPATTNAEVVAAPHGEAKPAARETVTMARQTEATGYKQALELISYQASYLLRGQASTEVTLSSDDLNALHQHIADGSINGSHMAKLQTRGDLQILRTLALSLAGGSDANGASLGNALDSLASARPNQRLVLGGLMQFAGQTDQAWADQTAGKPEDRLDAGARLRFDTGHMKAELARLDDSAARQVLLQLEGDFGDRAKAVCDFAVAQVSTFADSESSPEAVLVSRLTRMGNLVGSLTDELKVRLQLPESARGEPTMIDSVSQLTPLELAALAHIGVEAGYLE